jgi:hypothetical protein
LAGGAIHIVPELPVGRYLTHLQWLVDANLAIDDFMRALTARAGRPLAFRTKPLLVRFFRSVGRATPAAMASGWVLWYNVVGGINTSAVRVRETVFHEIFHFNDKDHGEWSTKTLTGVYQAILDRCSRPGARVPSTACLARYAPGSTIVRQGTYYEFQPGNDVKEYAAELAARYYTETQGALAGRPLSSAAAFKCLAPENAVAWSALAREFFGGVDVVPPCR